jgi:hypothetical protein
MQLRVCTKFSSSSTSTTSAFRFYVRTNSVIVHCMGVKHEHLPNRSPGAEKHIRFIRYLGPLVSIPTRLDLIDKMSIDRRCRNGARCFSLFEPFVDDIHLFLSANFVEWPTRLVLYDKCHIQPREEMTVFPPITISPFGPDGNIQCGFC